MNAKQRSLKFLAGLSFCCILSLLSLQSAAQQIGGLGEDLISAKPLSERDFPIVGIDQVAAGIRYDDNDYKGVIRAIGDLRNDIDSVTGVKLAIINNKPSDIDEIIIGTLGHSKLIDELVSAKKLATQDLKGKWESFVISTIPGISNKNKKCLVIAGSDKRGTIYGIYELSRQLGVSPWYWWADVPIQKRTAAYVISGRYSSGEPKVRYRGIFINDEAPCFTGWTQAKYGGRNSKVYTRMFELLLRLRANYLWPAMWSSAFNEDDPENPRLADEYGIVMGTSHHEPMLRAQREWTIHHNEFGNGEWNYVSNKQGVQDFWKQGLERNKNYESILTMGMRGDGDLPMPDAGSAQQNFTVLENIMADQRKIIEGVTHKPADQTPQIWALYSEVLEYFDQGMKVPDDMTILLCDDNWGDVRRLPELASKKRKGGYGMYYHVDLHGAPRAYQWLNMTQIPHMWEQLQLTYDYGVDKIWILNVGDLKPNEYPMDFFLNMAWNPKSFNQNNLGEYAARFCAQQFGAAQASEAADILSTYCKFNSRVTAEMLDSRTYNLESGEFLKVRDAYLALETRALRQYLELSPRYKDAYMELVMHPVRAMANLYDLYYAVAMNGKLTADKDLKANYWADHAEYCFKRDAELSKDYNLNVAGGKWNHLMDQTHIGYRSWDEPKGGNSMPKVFRVKPDEVKPGSFVFTEKNGVVAMEAEHYFEARANAQAQWVIIPELGRTLSGMALLPYTATTDHSALLYKMKLSSQSNHVTLRIFFTCTLPFKKGGQRVSAAFDGAKETVWNINEDLIWKNNYTRMYPSGAARIIESVKVLELPVVNDGVHLLQIQPLDPGVVIQKIVVDAGGYEPTHLKMEESPYKKEKI
ncbi:glycosyl hydrolase family 67 [Mucilaginibacter gracilis]|uniref:Glycosyl hydrolase family 67 n=1 Tax=Mucilaginibacter gracilis TaxID=423350 RepID=A0A495IYJ4_9SPHI|nr:glycosyl hydrolase 115 family protein [Mucilaginibacter gracilis]RKR81786.1 glycosyl hydrolase family 67 [Mucilaginibacter gracilis]